MSTGREYLGHIHQALREFEEAVSAKAGWKLLESKVTRQQAVDHARQKVVDAVVDIVTRERMKRT